jgi:hypothetical protein
MNFASGEGRHRIGAVAARRVSWHSYCQTSQRRYRCSRVWSCCQRAEEIAMDIGITKSNKKSPFHFVTGMFVVTVGYSAMMFAVRVYLVGI